MFQRKYMNGCGFQKYWIYEWGCFENLSGTSVPRRIGRGPPDSVFLTHMCIVIYACIYLNLKQDLIVIGFCLIDVSALHHEYSCLEPMLWEVGWLITYDFMSLSRIFHLYREVTIASEGLQNLGLCSALRAFEQGGIFIVPHLLWHGTSVFRVSSKRRAPMSHSGIWTPDRGIIRSLRPTL
jgi:hypothetical protein